MSQGLTVEVQGLKVKAILGESKLDSGSERVKR